jgi:hypothetical protein
VVYTPEDEETCGKAALVRELGPRLWRPAEEEGVAEIIRMWNDAENPAP